MAPGQKKAIEEQRTLVFADQSGFYLLPLVLRTYAPVGHTPVVKEYLSHDHLSAMSGITPEGKLYMTVQESSYKGPDVVSFLQHLLRHIPGKLLVLLGPSPDSSQQCGQGISGQGGGGAHSPGATPRLRPGAEPRRGHLELFETGGTQEPQLSQPISPLAGAPPSQGAAPS